MLNLAFTDHPDWGFAKGHYYLIVGTSRSGKTWLSLSCLAEASLHKGFSDYKFIYDDVERGVLIDIPRFFGKSVAERIKFVHSAIIEDFYDRLDSLCAKKEPFIYILDSMDALGSSLEKRTFLKQKRARENEEREKGSYGDGKAKINSQHLRQAITPLKETGSILIIINQTRDKLTGYGGKTHSGGNALQFYATFEVWSDIKRTLVKKYKGKDRVQGTLCTLRVKKNRATGKDRVVEVPIYNTYGIDDIGSCIDYCVSEQHWKKTSNGIITAPEFDFCGRREDLITLISEKNMEKDLSVISGGVWNDIENAIAIHRKPKYT